MTDGTTATEAPGGDLPGGRCTWQVIQDDADWSYEMLTEALSDGSVRISRRRRDKRTGRVFGDFHHLPPPRPAVHQPQCGQGHYGKTVSAETCVHGHETLQGTRL